VRIARASDLVVVDDLDLIRITIPPYETHPILTVDPDRVLTGPIASRRLQSIARRHFEVVQRLGLVDVQQLAAGDPGKALPVPMANPRGEEYLDMLASIGNDHRGLYPLRQA
jgi:hypothetical protein